MFSSPSMSGAAPISGNSSPLIEYEKPDKDGLIKADYGFYTAGIMESLVEIPFELAGELGLKGGERVKVSSARAAYVAKALVTRRIKPMMIDGKKTYQIGIPIHWGYRGIKEDEGKTALDPANQLSPAAIDPNAYTPEYKGFLVKIEKA